MLIETFQEQQKEGREDTSDVIDTREWLQTKAEKGEGAPGGIKTKTFLETDGKWMRGHHQIFWFFIF